MIVKYKEVAQVSSINTWQEERQFPNSGTLEKDLIWDHAR